MPNSRGANTPDPEKRHGNHGGAAFAVHRGVLRFPWLSMLLLLSPVLAAGCTGNLDGVTSGGTGDGTMLPDDGADPVILLVEPTIGAILPGSEVRLVGRVDDESPVTLATDEGTAIDVAPDGSFTQTLSFEPGSHRIRLVATDAGGRTGETFTAFANGTFADPTTMVEGAVLADVSSAALDVIADGAGTILTEASFDAQLDGANPVADGFWGEVNLRGEDHGAVTITLTPGDGRITASVAVAGITVRARASTLIGSANGELRADSVRVSATLALGADAGHLTANVESSNVDLSGTVIDVDNFPDAIENLGAVRDAIQNAAENALDGAVRALLPPLVADGIAAIPSGETVDVLETPLNLTVSVGALTIDPGGIGTAIDLGVSAAMPLPSRGSIGYLQLPHGAAPPTGDEVSVAVAFDALNAAFSALWAGGGLDQRIEGLTFGGGPLTVGALALLLPFTAGSAPADAPLVIDVSPRIPPMVVPSATDGVEVQAADLRITFIAQVDGGEMELATISVGVFAPASASAAGGSIAIALGDLRHPRRRHGRKRHRAHRRRALLTPRRPRDDAGPRPPRWGRRGGPLPLRLRSRPEPRHHHRRLPDPRRRDHLRPVITRGAA